MKKKLAVMLAGAAMIAAFSLTACGGNNTSSAATSTQTSATYNLTFSLDYSSDNTTKSDLIVKLDGKATDLTVSSGVNSLSKATVTAGSHELTVETKDDGKKIGSVTVNMTKDMTVTMRYENGSLKSEFK